MEKLLIDYCSMDLIKSKSEIHGDRHVRTMLETLYLLYKEQPKWLSFEKIDLEAVILFCLFHDCLRFNDEEDRFHGYRAATYLKELYNVGKIRVSKSTSEIAILACFSHVYNTPINCYSCQICRDIDRLNLNRVGITPNSKYMALLPANELNFYRLCVEEIWKDPPSWEGLIKKFISD